MKITQTTRPTLPVQKPKGRKNSTLKPGERRPQTLTDIKGETDSNTIIVGDFNNPLTPMNRSSKQKINKEICLK